MSRWVAKWFKARNEVMTNTCQDQSRRKINSRRLRVIRLKLRRNWNSQMQLRQKELHLPFWLIEAKCHSNPINSKFKKSLHNFQWVRHKNLRKLNQSPQKLKLIEKLKTQEIFLNKMIIKVKSKMKKLMWMNKNYQMRFYLKSINS